MIANAAAIQRPVCIATHNRMAANGADKNLAEYLSIAGSTLEITDDFDNLLQEEIYQVMLGCYKQEYPLVMKDVTHEMAEKGLQSKECWDITTWIRNRQSLLGMATMTSKC